MVSAELTWRFVSPPGADHREKKYKAHRQFGDRRGGVTGARTYFYADEAKCDNQMETFINCIKASGEWKQLRDTLCGFNIVLMYR